MEQKKWYVVVTRPQWERIVYWQLKTWYELEAWCPLRKEQRQWSDRVKTTETPIFTGYVFVRAMGQKERLQILQLDGVVKFINYEKKPAVVRDEEMAALKAFIEAYQQASVEPLAELQPGSEIALTKGVLSGIAGIITDVSRTKVTLELPRLGFRLTASPDTITKCM